MIKLKYLFLSIGFLLIISGCRAEDKPTVQKIEDIPPPPETITITAVGDFLMHLPVVNSAKKPDGGYDFKPIFSEVAGFLSAPDLTIVNLETRLGGKGFGYSGYPLFNTPEALATDLKTLGVDVVATANNHSLDMGWQGLVNTIDHLEAVGLSHIGTYRNVEESQKVFVTEVKGYKIGILNYAENTNGIPIPKGKEFAVDLINSEKIFKDIAKLNELNVDLIIAYLHFGTEYQRQPNQSQIKLVDDLFKQGVDIVFGNHVHVIQPMEIKQLQNQEVKKQHFVIYSLGNFVSNQEWRYSNCGLIVNVTLEETSGNLMIKDIDYVPVWVHIFNKEGKRNYRVLPVQKALEDYEAGVDTFLTLKDFNKLKEVWQDTTDLISKACPVISPKNVPGGNKI